jgi:hypothetical protein
MNPLRQWFDETKISREDFLAKVPISQSYLTLLLSEAPPWPSRAVMRLLVEATDGFVTADKWLALDDPPPQRATRGDSN